MIRILFACAILLGMARASAADDLLGSVSYSFGTGDEVTSYTKVAGISLEIGYDGSADGPICVRHRVGCMPIPTAQLVSGATFTFDTSSPWFDEIAAFLTNGVNDRLFSVDRAWSSANRIIIGGGHGGPTEAVAFGVPVDFHGSRITSIRLKLDTFHIGDNASCGGVPGGLCYTANLTWSIYGVPISTPVLPTSWGQVRATYR